MSHQIPDDPVPRAIDPAHHGGKAFGDFSLFAFTQLEQFIDEAGIALLHQLAGPRLVLRGGYDDTLDALRDEAARRIGRHVFATGGARQPTLTIAALATRLGEYVTTR